MENLKLLQYAKKELSDGNYTCVIAQSNEIVFTSNKRGVAPLVEFIQDIKQSGEYVLADKVIGKAAALLCIKSNIKTVFTSIISTPAIEVFKANGVYFEYDTEVPVIQNRTQTGLCPMESLSAGVDDPDVMYDKYISWITSK